jgi:hypothetical protein
MPRPIRSFGHTTRPSTNDLNALDNAGGTNSTNSSGNVGGDSSTASDPTGTDSSFDGTSSGPGNGLSSRPSGGPLAGADSLNAIDARSAALDTLSAVDGDGDPPGLEVYGMKLGKTEPGSVEHIVSGFVSREPGTLTAEEAAAYKACYAINKHFTAHLRVSLRGSSSIFSNERPPTYQPGVTYDSARPLKAKERFEVSFGIYARNFTGFMLQKRLGREPGIREVAKNVGTMIKNEGVDHNQYVKTLLQSGDPNDIAFASALRRYLR